MHFKGRDIVSINDFTRDEVLYLLNQATAFAKGNLDNLTNRVLRYGFWEDSTRTRMSFIRAAERQGMRIDGFSSAAGTSLNKNESTRDTLEMFRQFNAEVIIMRHAKDGAARYAAEVFDTPIINAGDGRNQHPTQTLLDLKTIHDEHHTLDGLTIGLVGDLKYGRTVHSLATAFRKYFQDTKFVFVSPEQLRMPAEYRDGHRDYIETDLNSAIQQCDIVYMTRMQLKRMHDERERREAMGSVLLTPELLERRKPGLKVMHPLPNDAKNPTIHQSLNNHPDVIHYKQAGNGVPVRETLLCAVLGAIGDDFTGNGYEPQELSDKAELESLHITSTGESAYQQRAVHSIGNGVVIDHIPTGLGRQLYNMFQLNGGSGILGEGFPSKTEGKKDFIKLVDYELKEGELQMIGVLAPTSRVNIIRDHTVARKYRVKVPDIVESLLDCENPDCISRDPLEYTTSKLHVTSREPATLSCAYCDTHCRYDL